jgi:uncharacterized repeat protein (TIGR01451 family)
VLGEVRVTAVTPDRGVTTGDQLMTITGTGFVAGQTEVLFGSARSRAVSVTSPTSLTAVTPPGKQGVEDVTVTVPGGSGTLPDGFSYEPPPRPEGPDLQLSLVHSGMFAVATPGVYTITVANGGDMATAGEIVVLDMLPEGLAYVSGTGTGWACTAEGPYVGCRHAGPLQPRTSLPALQLTVSVGAAAFPEVTNRARVWTAHEGGRPEDNRAADVTVVVGALASETARTGASITSGRFR